MIRGSELVDHALKIIDAEARPTEVELRVAISSAYYGLFHTLGAASISVLSGDDAETGRHLARLYDHSAFKKISADVLKDPANRSEAGKALLAKSSDPRLRIIAANFTSLLAARERADYDLAADITPSYAFERVQLAAQAIHLLTEVEQLPETRRFLLALTLVDRWPRRG